jgi:hypothetical protein
MLATNIWLLRSREGLFILNSLLFKKNYFVSMF